MDWGSSRPSSSMVGLEDSVYSYAHDFDLLQQRKRCMGRSPGNSRHKRPGFSPGGVAQNMLNSQVNECRDSTDEMSPTGKLIRDSGHRVFMGRYTQTPSALYKPRFQTSRGKQVFKIKYIVYTNNVGTVSHSYQFCEWWESFQIQVPRCQTRANNAS